MFNFSLAANLCFKDIFLGPKSSVKIQKTFFILCKPYISDDLVFLPNNGGYRTMRGFWRFLQLYLLLFFVCLAESLYAAPKYYFKQISLENGLSQSSVKCVLVDERGVMWIGTRFGLNRFDREKITVYQEERENPHSLPYNDIVFLEEDAEGNIWVGTCCGLAYFDRGTFRNLLLSLLPVIFIFLEWKGWLVK